MKVHKNVKSGLFLMINDESLVKRKIVICEKLKVMAFLFVIFIYFGAESLAVTKLLV